MRATDFYSEEAYEAALNERVATDAEAMQEMAWNMGAERSDRAWLLDDRDVWVRNPHYVGPAVRHPEDDTENTEIDRDFEAEAVAARAARTELDFPF